MSSIILRGASESTAVRRVALVCKELGIEYKLAPIPWSDIKKPEHFAIQPFGQVPVLEDDGFVLFESRAIGRYLTLKYGKGSPLLPPTSDLKATGLFEAAASIEQADFDPFAAAIVWELRTKTRMTGQPTDEKRLGEVTAILNSKLDGYERILSKTKYLAGENVTLADLFHVPCGYTLDEILKLDVLKTRPNVARWWQDIVSRPSWQAVKNGA